LPATQLAALDAMTLYRLRWQIELLFKRAKALLAPR
jgi:IS4 transposase